QAAEIFKRYGFTTK
ncbi:MAG: hypothetical protein RR750_12140, partial [Citrobacter sp.]